MSEDDSQKFLEDLQERAHDLIGSCQFASSFRLYGELRRRAKDSQQAHPYVIGTFFQMDQAQQLLDFKLMRERAVELIAMLEDEERVRQIQSDYPRENYDYLVYSMSSCAYENLAEATGHLEGFNSDGMHACIADGLQICRRTGKTACVSCFREYACDVYLAADDPDIAAHQCRLIMDQTASWSDRGNRRWVATGRMAWLEMLNGRTEAALELMDLALERINEDDVASKSEPRLRMMLQRDSLRICAGLESEFEADPISKDYPALGECPGLDHVRDLNAALLATRNEDWNAATQLLMQWDQRLQKCSGTHLWFETRLRLIAMKRLSGQHKQAAALERQLEQRARTANDYLTLRRLSTLQDAERPSLLAIAARVKASLDTRSAAQPAAEKHPSDRTDPTDQTTSSIEGEDKVVAPWLASLRERMTDLMQEPSDEKFESLRRDVLAVTTDTIANSDEAAGVLHLMSYLTGSGEDGESVWQWANALAAPHRNKAVVLSLLGTLGDALRLSGHAAVAEKITSERTEQLFRRSLELETQRPRNFMRAGDHFASVGNSGEAERCFARAFRLDRADGMIVRRLADLYSASDRPRDALHALDLSLRAGCQDSHVAFDAAMLAFRVDQYESALTYLDRFEAGAGDDLWTNYYRSVCHYELGQWQQGFEFIEKERTILGHDAWHLQLMRGVLRAHLGDHENSRRELNRVAATKLSAINSLSVRGIMELLQRMANVSLQVLNDDALYAQTIRRLLRSGLMTEGWFQAQREATDAEPEDEIRLYRCIVRQPLDETWRDDPDRLEDQADWTGYRTEWGVLATSEEQATELVLNWQSQMHSLPAEFEDFSVSDESYTDVPGVVWQGGRSSDTEPDDDDDYFGSDAAFDDGPMPDAPF